MCNEPRGFSGWPRKAGRWLMLAAAVLMAAALAHGETPAVPAPNSPDEPLAAEFSRVKAGAFLDAVALDWTEKRQCGACHTNYAYLITRPALKGEPTEAMKEIRTFFEDRVAHWDDAEKSAKPRWDTEVVATASALALNDALVTGTLHPRTKQALDRMWTLQKADGSWNWLKCDWPPYEHDDYYGVVFAAVGVGAAPEAYARSESARDGLAKLRAYLQKNPAPDLHHQTFLLWASLKLDGLMTSAEREGTIARLRALQRPDGGWNLPSLGDWKRRDGTPNQKEAASDGYATGLVVYVLRQAGVPADDPALRRAVAWLKTHQRAFGALVHALGEQRQGALHRQRRHRLRGAGVVGVRIGALRRSARDDGRRQRRGIVARLHRLRGDRGNSCRRGVITRRHGRGRGCGGRGRPREPAEQARLGRRRRRRGSRGRPGSRRDRLLGRLRAAGTVEETSLVEGDVGVGVLSRSLTPAKDSGNKGQREGRAPSASHGSLLSCSLAFPEIGPSVGTIGERFAIIRLYRLVPVVACTLFRRVGLAAMLGMSKSRLGVFEKSRRFDPISARHARMGW